MADPFMSEIKIYSFQFAPRNWAYCHGQLMSIIQNQALFSLLGTTFGGDGRVSFGLPDMRGRVPIGQMYEEYSPGQHVGELGGAEAHSLSISELPQHSHAVQASSSYGNSPIPTNNILAASPTGGLYTNPENLVAMNPTLVSNSGGSQPHENRQPYLALSFCIALQGIFPSQS